MINECATNYDEGAGMHNKPPQRVGLLVTDVDNTLFDWFSAWYGAFEPMLQVLLKRLPVERQDLIRQIKQLHELHGTAEYSFLLEDLPAMRKLPQDDYEALFAEALAAYREGRSAALSLYPGVRETLLDFKSQGIRVAAYTESQAFHTMRRLKTLGLDGVIDVLYSAPDHDIPVGIDVAKMRTRPESEYSLETTVHHQTPKGALKPNPEILTSILRDQSCDAASALYVGDSLTKDIQMAQRSGVYDVLAEYGIAHADSRYELLREVTHWPNSAVAAEKEPPRIVPSAVLTQGFFELKSLVRA